MRIVIIAILTGQALCGLLYAAEPGISPNPLEVTPSLSSTFLAGRTARASSPDGAGEGAYLDQPGLITGCRGKFYFVDLHGLRVLEPLTKQVTTIGLGYSNFRSLWCDGKFLYTSSTANNGRLTIDQLDLDTLQTSSFSFPALGSYTSGVFESLFGVGSDLYTTDSASGRIWKIDLRTRDRVLVADFGGPLLTPSILHPGRTFVNSVGPFWADGSDIYILRRQAAGPSVLTRIRIDTGETTPLLTDYFSNIWGQGSFLYIGQASGVIGKFNLTTGELSRFVSLNGNISWSDGQFVYFTFGFPEGAVGKIDPATAQISVIAGDLGQDIDGPGPDARFSIYLLPGTMGIHGDSKYLYITEPRSLRRFDRSAGILSTVATGLTYAKGVWTDGSFAYVVDGSAIRRVDLTTKEVRTIAGSLTEEGTIDGVGTEARFSGFLGDLWGDGASLYIVDAPNAIRKLELATGKVTTLVRNAGIYRGIWGTGRSLFVCNTRMVQKIDLDTLGVETVAGSDVEGTVDGVGTDAHFTRADGIWGNGTSLFVTDAMRSIRRIDLTSRRVTTIYNAADPISEGIFGDSSHLYVMEGFALRRYDPVASVLTFAAPGQGLSVMDLTPGSSWTVLQSEIRFSAEGEVAGATAIWGYRNADGVIVSEAAVPAQSPIRSGRIYADVQAPVNTGIAISNPNDVQVHIDFYFTNADGVDLQPGSFLLRPHEQIARFLNEAPFSGGNTIQGTFTFTASAPVAAIAIRGHTNQRSEFLMTTLPVADLDAPVSADTKTIAHFATGGGWRTEVLLVNPTDQVLSGTTQFIDEGGHPAVSYSYLIPARTSQRFDAESVSQSIEKGSVSITPLSNTPLPIPLVIFGYSPAGTTLTETGAPALEGTELASYVESTGPSADEVNSGIAIANTTDQPISVFLRLATSAGAPFGQNATVQLGPRGQSSKFLSELFPTLQLPFIGVLHISTSSNISVTGLRGRYNARHEFIVSTVTPMIKGARSQSPLYLPHLITGGGYTTRLFLINPTGSWATGTINLLNTDGTAVSN